MLRSVDPHTQAKTQVLFIEASAQTVGGEAACISANRSRSTWMWGGCVLFVGQGKLWRAGDWCPPPPQQLFCASCWDTCTRRLAAGGSPRLLGCSGAEQVQCCWRDSESEGQGSQTDCNQRWIHLDTECTKTGCPPIEIPSSDSLPIDSSGSDTASSSSLAVAPRKIEDLSKTQNNKNKKKGRRERERKRRKRKGNWKWFPFLLSLLFLSLSLSLRPFVC